MTDSRILIGKAESGLPLSIEERVGNSINAPRWEERTSPLAASRTLNINILHIQAGDIRGNMAEEHADCEFFSPVRLLLIVPASLAQTEGCLSFNSTGSLALEECAFISTWTIES